MVSGLLADLTRPWTCFFEFSSISSINLKVLMLRSAVTTFGQTYQRLGSLALDLQLRNAVQIFLNPDLVGVILS
jgi:hypothetical protein